MEITTAAMKLSALAHETRLTAFRMLIEAGENGIAAGVIARTLEIPPNTLTSHLGQLQKAGLVEAERQSRFIIYRIVPKEIASLLGFLLEDCCNGSPDLCRPAVKSMRISELSDQT